MNDIAPWLNLKEQEKNRHRCQFDGVFRSTEKFCDWLISLGLLDAARPQRVLDVCCGMGANVAYMAKRFPTDTWEGFDINDELIAEGQQRLAAMGLSNAEIRTGDLFNINADERQAHDGLTMYLTLMNLEEELAAVDAICSLSRHWIAVTTPVYDGPVSVRMEITNHAISRANGDLKTPIYIWSWAKLDAALRRCGMRRTWYTPYEIDIDLPKPSPPGLGGYTERLADGRRLHVSGPLLMPWSFVAASRDEA